MNIQDEILKSIEVMIDKSLNKYNSTRTKASIVEDVKNGKYQVTIDGAKCYVYDSVGCNPKVGTAVWVNIPNGSIHNAFITGRKNKSVDGLFNGSNNNNSGGSGGGFDGTDSLPDDLGGGESSVILNYNFLTNKPSINGQTLINDFIITLADLQEDTEHRLITDSERELWNSTVALEPITSEMIQALFK